MVCGPFQGRSVDGGDRVTRGRTTRSRRQVHPGVPQRYRVQRNAAEVNARSAQVDKVHRSAYGLKERAHAKQPSSPTSRSLPPLLLSTVSRIKKNTGSIDNHVRVVAPCFNVLSNLDLQCNIQLAANVQPEPEGTRPTLPPAEGGPVNRNIRNKDPKRKPTRPHIEKPPTNQRGPRVMYASFHLGQIQIGQSMSPGPLTRRGRRLNPQTTCQKRPSHAAAGQEMKRPCVQRGCQT